MCITHCNTHCVITVQWLYLHLLTFWFWRHDIAMILYEPSPNRHSNCCWKITVSDAVVVMPASLCCSAQGVAVLPRSAPHSFSTLLLKILHRSVPQSNFCALLLKRCCWWARRLLAARGAAENTEQRGRGCSYMRKSFGLGRLLVGQKGECGK